MLSAIVWGAGIAASIAALAVSAAHKMYYVHMGIAAAAGILVALAAVMATRPSATGPSQRAHLASHSVRTLGLVWAWAALAIFVTYAFVLQWREWWHFVLAFGVLSAACLFLAAALNRDAESAGGDDTLLKLARIIAIVHLGAMLITLIGLILDGKLVRFLNPRHQDWAAQNIFFFGAFALAAIGWNMLATMRSEER